MKPFKRAILKGTLTTQTNFHLGSGQESAYHEIEQEEPGSINELCLDANKQPYIPASSLRGYLRHIIANGDPTQEIENKLFGLARQKKGAAEEGNMGALRIYDARWVSPDYTPNFNSQTRIEAVTGSAKKHHLSTHAIVPPQSSFSVVIEFDHVDEDQIKIILQALQTFSSENQGQLGKARSTGQGKMHWQQDSLKVLSENKLKEWLTPKKNSPSNKPIKEKKFDALFHEHTLSTDNEALTSKHHHITVYLKAESPILINDPYTVKQREQEYKKDNINNPPDHIYMQENDCAIIPGSTLKGWARGRCRRIIFSLLTANAEDNEHNEKTTDAIIDQLFGNTQQQSLLFFHPAKVALQQGEQGHTQTFNAIDRFTGGVKLHALYSVEAIWPHEAFVTQIHYVKEKLENWMKLLLLYLIRDGMEGDLVLGWGKSKGYGRLTLSTEKHENWEHYYQPIHHADLQAWNESLQKKLRETSHEIS